MYKYFAFNKLEQYTDIFNAAWISLAVFFIVWVLTSLYYDVWRDQYVGTPKSKVRQSDAPKNEEKD